MFDNLGDISKPATVLIEKISDAIGGYFKPYQIKRIANAESEAEIIRVQSQIEVTEIQRRAMIRWVGEESQKQDNIEKITQKALPELEDSASPQKVEKDWITNFFDKCRIISDEEMQSLWAKVLAGEANAPGTYSKRTVNLISSLDKSDAQLFTALCGFRLWILGNMDPVIFDVQNPVYNTQSINFGSLSHLDDIGLISFSHLTGFRLLHFPQNILVIYNGDPIQIQFKKEADNELDIGHVMFTQAGEQLSRICNSKPVDGFLDYIMERWIKKNLILSSPYPKQDVKIK